MLFLNQKDEEILIEHLRDYIKSKLLDGFKNYKGQLVIEVEALYINKIELDKEKSNRDILLINILYAEARVYVHLMEGSKSSNNLTLRNNIPLELQYNDQQGQYIISNGNNVVLLDMSQW